MPSDRPAKIVENSASEISVSPKVTGATIQRGRKSPSTGVVQETSSPALVARPLLTICVPTYKRGKHSTALAKSIIANILSNPRYNVDLVIVNNCSPDDTAERLSSIHHPRFKLINRDEHLDTAEENIIRSLPFATGEYVWFLGDDDVIYFNNFESHYEMMETGKFDLLIFNSSLISPSGKVVRQQSMKMTGAILSMPLDQIVERIGLLFTFAGVSNVIQRTSTLSVESGLEWLATSKIYSHVAWIIDQHHASSVVLVNSPLVFYRQNDYSDGHWERVAEKQEVPNLYFWSLGLVRLLNRLVEKGAFSYQQAGSIFEQAVDGSRYRLLDDIIFKTFQQIELGAVSKMERQTLSTIEFEEIADFVLKCDPMTYDILDALREGHKTILAVAHYGDIAEKALDKLRGDFMSLYIERQEAGQFFSRFAAKIMGYDIYKMPGSFIAVKENNIALREEVLRIVDPSERGMSVLIAETMRDLEPKILRAYEEQFVEARAVNDAGPTPPAISLQVDTAPLMAMTQMLNDQTRANNDLMARINSMYSSSSWQITAPLRTVMKLFRRKA